MVPPPLIGALILVSVGIPRRIMVKVLDSGLKIREIEFNSRCKVDFRTNNWKCMNPLIPQAMGYLV